MLLSLKYNFCSYTPPRPAALVRDAAAAAARSVVLRAVPVLAAVGLSG